MIDGDGLTEVHDVAPPVPLTLHVTPAIGAVPTVDVPVTSAVKVMALPSVVVVSGALVKLIEGVALVTLMFSGVDDAAK